MVSVIIPNYNHAKYLNERVDSIINQTFQDFEIIILDDKSSDESKIIIEQYRDHPKVSHIVINKQNSGSPFIQWKKGIDLAKGDLIWIAESDDYAAPTFLEECIKHLLNNPDTVLCFSESFFVDENSNLIKHHKLEALTDNPKPDGFIKYNGLTFLEKKLLKHNYVYNASMVVFRKEFFSKVSNKYTSMRGCGDWVFWGEMASFGNIIKITKRLNYFRHHNNSTTLKEKKNGSTEGHESILHLASLDCISQHRKLIIYGRLDKRLRKLKKKDYSHFTALNSALDKYCNYRTKAYLYYRLKFIINPVRFIFLH